MPADQSISYAQFHEDLHLARCFGEQTDGFYIDIGAGHPVHCNVSFLFYLAGWRGLTVEPNAWLAQLSEAVRPRDRVVRALVGAEPGEATFYLMEDLHDLSTMDAGLAQTVEQTFGNRAQPQTLAVTTLRALCAEAAPDVIDFLKIDVEGAEQAVLRGNDWQRFRPKVVMAEALVPISLAQAWSQWEAILTDNAYRFAYFDGLNRYYVAEEHAALAERLQDAPAHFDGVTQFRALEQAAKNPAHPDHRLAGLVAGLDPVRLPLLPLDDVVEHLAARLESETLDRGATPGDVEAIHRSLFGQPPPTRWADSLGLTDTPSLRDLYRGAVMSEAFRAACGRISASYAP